MDVNPKMLDKIHKDELEKLSLLSVGKPVWWERVACRMIRTADVPKHIAFIMDGNRRYSRERNISSRDAYMGGGQAISRMVRWAVMLGVRELSLYAFSVENFKRTKDELDLLFGMAMDLVLQARQDEPQLRRLRMRIRFLGNLDLLPVRMQVLMGELNQMCSTWEHDYVVNLCLAYTARHELAASVDRLVLAQADGVLRPEELSVPALDRCLYTFDSQPPEMLVRTSGEIRFSDFMLWQLNHSLLCFLRKNWPELTGLNFLFFVLRYQLQVTANRFLHFYELRMRPADGEQRSTLRRAYDFTERLVQQRFEAMRLGETVRNLTPVFEKR